MPKTAEECLFIQILKAEDSASEKIRKEKPLFIMRLRATIEAKYATCRYISQTLLQLKKQQEGRRLLSVPVGIAMSLSDILQKVMFPMPALLQTPPGFVYLIPLISLFSVTKSKLRGIAIILHTAPETGRNVHGFSKVRATTPLDGAAQYCVRRQARGKNEKWWEDEVLAITCQRVIMKGGAITQ